MPVLAAGASSGHTPGLIFDVSSRSGQSSQRETHCVGAQSVAVAFLVRATVIPSVELYERNGVQLSLQLAGGVYTVDKGLALQLVLQKADCASAFTLSMPPGEPGPPDMLCAVVSGSQSIGRVEIWFRLTVGQTHKSQWLSLSNKRGEEKRGGVDGARLDYQAVSRAQKQPCRHDAHSPTLYASHNARPNQIRDAPERIMVAERSTRLASARAAWFPYLADTEFAFQSLQRCAAWWLTSRGEDMSLSCILSSRYRTLRRNSFCQF
jgi:hypothetical protein